MVTRCIARFLLSVIGGCIAATAGLLSVPGDFPNIGAAMAEAQSGDTVLVADGTYKESVLLTPGVVLRAETLHGAAIRAKGRDPAVTMANNNALIGFVVERSTMGVLSRGRDNLVKSNKIVRNDQSGVVCVGHLPQMEDNVIAFNGASGIQGRDVRSTNATITHNTIAYNRGHGLSIGGSSDVAIEYSIIAFNEKSDIWAEQPTARVTLTGNDLYRNGRSMQSLPEGNVTVDPEFVGARKLDFKLSPESRCRRGAPDNSDIGVRF
ncbi:MAG: hypothetical protein GF331_01375 [Chitinivibrionales bacterium]|nr:hypothetical protein [Chitinivibrionales bacterium]